MAKELAFRDSVLNVLLIAAGPEAPVSQARHFQAAIPTLREHFTIPSQVEWLAGYAAATESTWRGFKRYYNPLTYACLGAFDVAMVYLSPTTGQPRPRANQWPGSGLYLNLCLLPDLGKDCPNAAFIKGYVQPLPTDRPLPAERRFLLVSKLKLNSPAVWPRIDRQPQQAVHDLLFRTAEAIQDWLGNTAAPGSTAAISLGLGWSEVVVVANSSSITALIHLVWALRCLAAPVGWKPRTTGHCFSTSLSHIGYDYHIIECSEAAAPSTPSNLVATARGVASRFSPGAAPRVNDFLSFQTAFSVYPGHEALLAKVCGRVEAALGPLSEVAAAEARGAGGIVGRLDLAGPVVRTSEEISEVEALASLALLRRMALRTDPIDASYQPEGLLNFYASNTSVGLSSITGDTERGAIPQRHYNESASNYSMPGARALDRSLRAAIDDLADSMRILQVPYSRTEQILHLVAKYHWTTRLDVLWEDAAPLAPLVFSLRNYLRGLCAWWDAISLRELPAEVDGLLAREDARTRTAVHIRERLETLLTRELPALLDAFRTNFQYRHMGGYLTDQLPDINLRYLGSVHQILNITNMVLDLFTSVVLGRRACVATTGDPSVPDIETAADVVLLRVHADTINTPILLESLGHEVGHLWFLEMRRDREREQERRVVGAHSASKWAAGCSEAESYRKVQQAYFAVIDAAFFGEIDKNNYLIETLADYVECRLLGCGLEEWSASFLFRNLVLAPIVHQDSRPEDRVPPDSRPLVPGPAPLYLEAGVLRTIGVCILDSLAGWDTSERYEDHLKALRKGRLRKLQRHLATSACLGPARKLHKAVLEKDAWDGLLGECEEWMGALFEPVVAKEVKALCAAIDSHLAAQRRALSPLELALFQQVTDSFQSLRRDLLPLLTNSLHVKWFAVGMDSEAARRQPNPADNQWRVQPQPATEAEKLEKLGILPRPDTLLFQRGAIYPSRPAVAAAMLRATVKFLGTCLVLLPGWRKQLLSRIEELES